MPFPRADYVAGRYSFLGMAGGREPWARTATRTFGAVGMLLLMQTGVVTRPPRGPVSPAPVPRDILISP